MTTPARRYLQQRHREREVAKLPPPVDRAPSPPPADRTPCPPSHPHGTKTTCYAQHKCRCQECRRAWNAYMREQRARAKAGHVVPRVSNDDELRAHLRKLHASGASWNAIARRVGVATKSVQEIARGTYLTVNAELRRQLFAIAPTQLNQRVPIVLASSRVRALQRMGYTVERVARMAGLSSTFISRVVQESPEVPHISLEAYQKIDVVFRAYGDVPAECPPSHVQERKTIERTKRVAVKRGYASFLEVDWEELDRSTRRS